MDKQPPGFVANVAYDELEVGCYEEALSFNFPESIAAKLIEASYGKLVRQ